MCNYDQTALNKARLFAPIEICLRQKHFLNSIAQSYLRNYV